MKHKAESIVPYNSNERKSKQIIRMFDSIATNYDKLNRTLSLGIDKLWRKKAIASLKSLAPATMLDIASGTGDFAIEACRMLHPSKVIAADISEGMMNIGRDKVKKLGLQDVISFEYQDCTNLTLPSNSFDAITAGFGVRNFEDLEQGYREMHRVLKPGGKAVILELSTPEYFPMKQMYKIYSKIVIPVVGRSVSKESRAYSYLPESIKHVPQGKEMCKIMSDSGFTKTSYKTFTFGVCTMYTAIK